jgi:hypothetical protein
MGKVLKLPRQHQIKAVERIFRFLCPVCGKQSECTCDEALFCGDCSMERTEVVRMTCEGWKGE